MKRTAFILFSCTALATAKDVDFSHEVRPSLGITATGQRGTMPPREAARKLADLRAQIAVAEKALTAAQASARADFAAWVDKLPEGPGQLVPEGEIARFAFDALVKNESPNAIAGGQSARANGAPKLVAGKHGSAVELDGENGFTFPGVGHFTRSDEFTFGLWLQAPALTERAVVFHHSKAPEAAGSRGYELLLENGHVAFGLHHLWPGNSLQVVTKKAVAAGTWAHVAVTYDGSSHAGGVRMFIDGQPAETKVVRDNLEKDITTDGDGEPELALGHRSRDAGFKGGRVDDFRIFNRALSPIEAASLADRDDYTEAVQHIPDLNPAQHEALLAYYVATAHQPSLDAAKALHAAREEERKFANSISEAHGQPER